METAAGWPDPQFWDDLKRFGCALGFAAAIGWEREWRRKPAGLRTHILVALGAAGFVLVTLRVLPADAANGAAAADLSRVIQGIVGGIGFLGAGTILQHRGNVEGLTTAASLWLTAAVGIAAATGEMLLGLLMTAMALFVLLGLGALTPPPRIDDESARRLRSTQREAEKEASG